MADRDAASYFLLRLTSAKWAFVTYVPEEVTKVGTPSKPSLTIRATPLNSLPLSLQHKTSLSYQVKEKMLYASTKDALKSAFGPEYVAEDVHVTSKEDILGKSSSVEASSRDNCMRHIPPPSRSLPLMPCFLRFGNRFARRVLPARSRIPE